jgi:hypothetical protein
MGCPHRGQAKTGAGPNAAEGRESTGAPGAAPEEAGAAAGGPARGGLGTDTSSELEIST